jgi:hypothetical protein
MKLKNLLSLAAAILFVSSSFAAVVQPNSATTTARNFMYERLAQSGVVTHLSEISTQLVETRLSGDLPVYYVYNVNDNGWVIVSGDDVYLPIIGYSLESKFPEGDLAKNFSSFLQDYVDQIEFARVNNLIADNSTIEQWNYYSNSSTDRMIFDGNRDVEPLLEAMWNQTFPYNAYCPADPEGTGGHALTGCVATAMSMIMYYYRYPEVGIGSYSYYCSPYGPQSVNFGETYYNWDAMLNTVTSTMGSTINAVAEINYHCGVSVDMGYGVDASGSYSYKVPPAIKSRFGYSSLASFIEKKNFTPTNWENTLNSHLDAKKLLYYSGVSTEGGHAFVCDGYQVTGSGNMYHFNFGWGGQGNGYFSLYDVNGFSSQQGMVKNFVPATDSYPYQCGNHDITVPLGSIEDMSGPLNEYEENSGCTWLIAPTDPVTSITINFTKFELGAGDSVKIYAGYNESAKLLASFGQTSTIHTVTSDTSAMFIKFTSDGAEQGNGFRGEFSSTFPVYCTTSITSLTAPTGEFTDGSGDYNYNNNTTCKWKINPGSAAKDLTLAFTEFELDEGDYLRIYDIPTNVLLAELTGDEIPDPIVSSTGQMMIAFITNGYNNKQGFAANYYISNVNTHEEELTQNLSIYPNPASTYSDIKFNLKEASQITISLHSLLGEEIYRETSRNSAGFISKTIMIGDISKGVYLLKISSDKGSVTRKLVVK